MRKLYGIIFTASLAISIANAWKVISDVVKHYTKRIYNGYLMKNLLDKYYVGIYCSMVGGYVTPSGNVMTRKSQFAYVWVETSCRTKKRAEEYRAFISKYLNQETADRTFVVQIDPLHCKNTFIGDGISYRFGKMSHTPFLDDHENTMMRTLEGMLSAGRLIYNRHKELRKPKWNDL